MACNCDPVTSSPSGNCCILGSSVPSGQFVRWTVLGDATPQILVPAYQLTNATPTVLAPAVGTQRFWVYALHAQSNVQTAFLEVYWTTTGGTPTSNSYFFRGASLAGDLRRYEGPAVPLPINAELYVLSEDDAIVTVTGYGLLETI